MNHSLTGKGYETASSWQPVSHATESPAGIELIVTFLSTNVTV